MFYATKRKETFLAKILKTFSIVSSFYCFWNSFPHRLHYLKFTVVKQVTMNNY
jgi:hypothetical protein